MHLIRFTVLSDKSQSITPHMIYVLLQQKKKSNRNKIGNPHRASLVDFYFHPTPKWAQYLVIHQLYPELFEDY